MHGIRAFSFAVAFLAFGFFFLASTEEGFSGFSTDVGCCQGEGQCVDTIQDPNLVCLSVDFVENAFCDQDTGQCTLITGIAPIPTLNEWGLIAMAGVLGIAGFLIIRRRKAAA